MELQSESVTAFTVRNFEIGIDLDGDFVMRLTHRQDDALRRTTYSMDFDHGLRLVSAPVKAAKQAERFRSIPDTRQ